MTFVINATVTEVTTEIPDRGNTLVRLSATAGEEVTNHGQTVQAVYSNTEGVIRSVAIVMIVEGTDAPLAVGDVVLFNGHFSAPKTP